MRDSNVIKFLWHHIKPYKWCYLVMVAAPIISSFYPFVYNYAIKLIIDVMASPNITFDYHAVLYPIILFLSAQLILDGYQGIFGRNVPLGCKPNCQPNKKPVIFIDVRDRVLLVVHFEVIMKIFVCSIKRTFMLSNRVTSLLFCQIFCAL